MTSLAIILISNFTTTITSFKDTSIAITTIMQVVSPFLMTVLIATGGITTTGIIQPLILFLSSFIGFVITNVVIPLLTISVAFNILNGLNINLKLSRLSKLFSQSAVWIVGVVLTLFLGVIQMETSITSSVDSLAVKTTSVAVSNFVPVVGKFFTDSFETVVGAAKIVNKVGGTIGIIAIICVTFGPLIKIISIACIYNLLSAIAEPISSDENMVKVISYFASIYKTMAGILIGIVILFVISIRYNIKFNIHDN